eukprot:CAMPEP_0172534886 /NCGR_PEP_ID=MMETSP1067-20121228/7100_1 /TAXON_ID=265564 ORGANISM="Thalassiosira punctigera, Strain Tpunct2005C2" /NCGR_SAMPLE_ID=MMETSP1067 /ASSEMBLY_ACC=CAM_ASM_000444 /LENGTH=257 /DNA_ID=CAMNT_0013319743 /DNA_START=81 /DNA_END=854 /DNA_ORIENTATION=+
MRTSKHLKPDSTHSITTTNAGAINAHIFEPKLPGEGSASVRGTIVTVHPWAALGGGEHNTIGIARHITNSSSKLGHGWRVITFSLKSSGAVWGICSAHSYEVQQTVDVVNWVVEKYGTENIVLFGSSAGAPIAGTAMAQLLQQQEKKQQPKSENSIISAYIAVGYTFGNFATLGFGRHFVSVVGSSGDQTTQPPKLFIMGERDEFTTFRQLEQMAQKMKANGEVATEIVADVGHFELESSTYDPLVAKMVMNWLDKV